jgi:septal ring factor EnvC (AmiA/AmiB activator)
MKMKLLLFFSLCCALFKISSTLTDHEKVDSRQKALDSFESTKHLLEENIELQVLKSYRLEREIIDDCVTDLKKKNNEIKRLNEQVSNCQSSYKELMQSVNILEENINTVTNQRPKPNECPQPAPAVVKQNCYAETRRLKDVNESLPSEVQVY